MWNMVRVSAPGLPEAATLPVRLVVRLMPPPPTADATPPVDARLFRLSPPGRNAPPPPTLLPGASCPVRDARVLPPKPAAATRPDTPAALAAPPPPPFTPYSPAPPPDVQPEPLVPEPPPLLYAGMWPREAGAAAEPGGAWELLGRERPEAALARPPPPPPPAAAAVAAALGSSVMTASSCSMSRTYAVAHILHVGGTEGRCGAAWWALGRHKDKHAQAIRSAGPHSSNGADPVPVRATPVTA